MVSPVLALYSLGKLFRVKVVLDKTAESIIIEKRPFLLLDRQRVIPFSAVKAVAIDYARERPKWWHMNNTTILGESEGEVWKVALETEAETIEIAHTHKRWGMPVRSLAREISRFLRKELEDHSPTLPSRQLSDSDVLSAADRRPPSYTDYYR